MCEIRMPIDVREQPGRNEDKGNDGKDRRNDPLGSRSPRSFGREMDAHAISDFPAADDSVSSGKGLSSANGFRKDVIRAKLSRLHPVHPLPVSAYSTKAEG
jgi:hypothetical protein